MYTKYEKYFQKVYKKSSVKFMTFPVHVDIVRHWVERLCDNHPEADRDVAIVAALFHDLGHFVESKESDHAVVSEIEAIKFLKKQKANEVFIEKVAHAIRAHRNADVRPETIEAKILVFSDSASHLTAPYVYLYVAAGHGKEYALAKLERDFRDLQLFPKEKKQLQGLYKSWKDVLETFPEDFYPFIREKESA